MRALTDLQRAELRRRRRDHGETYEALAEAYGVSRPTVRAACRGVVVARVDYYDRLDLAAAIVAGAARHFGIQPGELLHRQVAGGRPFAGDLAPRARAVAALALRRAGFPHPVIRDQLGLTARAAYRLVLDAQQKVPGGRQAAAAVLELARAGSAPASPAAAGPAFHVEHQEAA